MAIPNTEHPRPIEIADHANNPLGGEALVVHEISQRLVGRKAIQQRRIQTEEALLSSFLTQQEPHKALIVPEGMRYLRFSTEELELFELNISNSIKLSH